MRALPPPAVEIDLGERFPAAARQAIDLGELALRGKHENSIPGWRSVGAAAKALQNVALNRSGANSTASPKYRRVSVLVYAWPELANLDKRTRLHAIWLFDDWDDPIKPWYETSPQKQRDQWTHPTVIRRHYDKRHPGTRPNRSQKPRPPQPSRRTDTRPLGDRSREGLEAIIAGQDTMLAERDRTIIELNDQIEEERRTIEQLRMISIRSKQRACSWRVLLHRSPGRRCCAPMESAPRSRTRSVPIAMKFCHG